MNRKEQKNDSKQNSKKPYEISVPRASKEDVYMMIALWIQNLDDEKDAGIKGYRKVGAVLSTAEDKIFAADYSRDGVHAIARLLMKHYNKAEGAKVFMSRKPCPMCAKLLVQSKIKHVYFLPNEPEYYRDTKSPSDTEIKKCNEEEMKQVDAMFKSSEIAQTIFVFQLGNDVRKHEEERTPVEKQTQVKELVKGFKEKYGDWEKEDWEWTKRVKEELPWPVFDDIKNEVSDHFNAALEWMARVIVACGRSDSFQLSKFHDSKVPLPEDKDYEPGKNEKQADCIMTIARFLSRRTDDPRTGVGAVMINSSIDIVAFGWNGFPQKARYGEFGRGSGREDDVEAKFPYVIHAEQNALLNRNCNNMNDAILFVTKSPCNECAPLIAMVGVKTVVVDEEVKEKKEKEGNGDDTCRYRKLMYNKFPEMIKTGAILCYESKKFTSDKGIPPEQKTKQNMDFKDGE